MNIIKHYFNAKNIFLYLGVIFSINFSYAQDFAWAKSMGGTSYEWTNSIIVENNNVYNTGHFTGTVDFDPSVGVFNLTSSGQEDAFISKYDGNGNFVWAKSVTGFNYVLGSSIVSDGVGNIYITGYYMGTADFDPGVGTYNLTSTGQQEAFVLKLDTNGNFLWAKSFGGSGQEQGESILIDAFGNLYIVGHFDGVADFDPGIGVYNISPLGTKDLFILKLDSNGDFVWVKNIGGGYVVYPDATIDNMNNICITGVFRNTVDFDPGTGTYNLSSSGINDDDIFIVKLDNNGNFLWANSVGGSGQDYGYAVTTDNLNNVYFTGWYNGTVDFNSGVGTYNLTATGNADIFISKLDASGIFVWAKSIGGTSFDYGLDITVDSYNNIYSTGWFGGTTDFDPGMGTYNLIATSNNDIFISKLDASGNFVWAKSMGGSGYERGNTIFVENDSTIYVGGYYQSTVDFDPGSNTYNMTAVGQDDIFILKLGQCTPSYFVDIIPFCDSITWLDNNTYTSSTNSPIYTIVGGAYNGCDSIINLNLTIHNSAITNQNAFACQGDSILIGGVYQSTAGTYYDSLQTVNGCDSIIATTLTINPNYFNTNYDTICQGDSILIGGIYQTTAGTYYDSLQTFNGCDSVIATTLTINPNYFNTNYDTICQGDSILIAGVYQTTAGTYYDSLQTVNSCDSVIATTLTISPNYFNTNYDSICQGDSILIGGVYQSTAGTYYDSLQTVNGCDSVIATTLTINSNYFNTNYDTICQGDSILISGIYQNTAGTYYDSLQTVNGCDSIVEVVLSVDTSLTAYFTKSIDPNDSLNLLITNLATGNNLQYLWDFGDGNTSTQAYPNHTYATIGVYNLCLTITDSLSGCSSIFCDSTTVMRTTGVKTIQVISSTTSIDEVDYLDNISLFPNPTQNTFTLNLIETKSTQILVTSIEGKIMYNKVINNNNVEIDASKWANGLYFVNVMIDNQQKVFKLIKQ